MATAGELEQVIETGVPEEALRFFGRWWQLETYLREVLYVELRCRYGGTYVEQLGSALKLADRDRVHDHMASADASDPLAYLDAGKLIETIDEHRKLCEAAVLPEEHWKLAVTQLRQLRNRVSHCRRPHRDDLGRMRQLLRDLEHGARRFYGSYHEELEPPLGDPFAKDWIKGRHPAAERLIGHAERKYEVRMRVALTRRPWAEPLAGSKPSDTPGYLWHVHWILGSGVIRPWALWERLSERPATAQRPVHLLMANPFSLTATFASIDDAAANADAVGVVFEELCATKTEETDRSEAEHDWPRWQAEAQDLPRKVQANTTLALFDPIFKGSLFDAEEHSPSSAQTG